MSFDDWQQAATPEQQKGRVCFDREARTALLETLSRFSDVKAFAAGKLDQPEDVEALAERVKELDAEVEASTKTLTFGKIPRAQWREIEQAHPATDAQRKQNPRQIVDPAGFDPAIAAACCVDPGMTVEQAEWLYDFLPDDEWDTQVKGPILVANRVGATVPKGVSSIADRLISELKSITAPPVESL